MKVIKISSLAFAELVFIRVCGVFDFFFDWSVGYLDGDFFTFDTVALLLIVFGGDAGGIVIRNDASISKLIGEGFGPSDKVVKILESSAASLNEEANAIAARFLCL